MNKFDAAAHAASIAARTPEARAATAATLLAQVPPERRARVAAQLQHVPDTMRAAYLRAALGQASAGEALKVRCLDCACWQRREVVLCTAAGCPSWSSRPGRAQARATAEVEIRALEAEGLHKSAEVLRRLFVGSETSPTMPLLARRTVPTAVPASQPAEVDLQPVPSPASARAAGKCP
jgi:hypothetical protein